MEADTPHLIHASDCAVHNEPALPAGPCDCGAETAALAFAKVINEKAIAQRDATIANLHKEIRRLERKLGLMP